jgi:hypothetical protein
MKSSSDTATNKSAQGINSRIESILFDGEEPTDDNDDVVSDDVIDPKKKVAPKDDASDLDDELPKDDDTDSEEEEGSDLDKVATDEELSLADYLGIPEDSLEVDEDGKVAFKAVIDGKDQLVPLNELAKSYQLQGHVNNKSIALETERKEFRQEREAYANEIQTRVKGLEKLSAFMETELVAEFNKIDWDNIRRVKPAEWSALRQEFAERAQKIKQAKALAFEESERITEEQAREFVETRSKILTDELNKVITNNPTWADPAVRKSDQDKMRSFLNTTYGYTDQDFATVIDSRLILLIQDAQRYREGKQTVVKKAQKNVPKFRKPGANRADSANLAKARDVKAKRAQVKKTGNIRDVANLLVDRM